jgi:hypothetical protein
MYEVHQREWYSNKKVAVLFKSDSLQECLKFKNEWNSYMSELYYNYSVECMYFSSVYNPEKDDYLRYILGEDGHYHAV